MRSKMFMILCLCDHSWKSRLMCWKYTELIISDMCEYYNCPDLFLLTLRKLGSGCQHFMSANPYLHKRRYQTGFPLCGHIASHVIIWPNTLNIVKPKFLERWNDKNGFIEKMKSFVYKRFRSCYTLTDFDTVRHHVHRKNGYVKCVSRTTWLLTASEGFKTIIRRFSSAFFVLFLRSVQC